MYIYIYIYICINKCIYIYTYIYMYICYVYSAYGLNYNHFHNILRFFDVLPNFSLTTSETIHDYYLKTWYIRVASGVTEQLKI